MTFNSPKRNRGFTLSLVGWEKFQTQMDQIEKKRGAKFTQQALIKQIQLIDAQGLHPITLRKILGRQIGVDERSLRLVFRAIDLELETVDYQLALPKDNEAEADKPILASDSLRPIQPRQSHPITAFASTPPYTTPDFPGGPIPLDSPFYIEPTRLLTNACQEISRPGGLIRIKAPQKSGKSSFALRLLHHTESIGFKTLKIDFQQVDEALFSDLDRFLRWFCTTLSYQLDLKAPIQEYWNHDVGSKVSCTVYLQKALLKPLQSPVVLVLNEVNRLFEHPLICREFLPLLRSWYEEAKCHPVLQKLHFVLIYSTEIYVSLHLNQSPFNIGLPIELPELTLKEIQELAGLYGFSADVAVPLKELVGGRPYLIQLGLYHLYHQQVRLEQLLQDAISPTGIYANHLRQCLSHLQQEQELIEAFRQVLVTHGQVHLNLAVAYKLESLGLIKLDKDRTLPSCKLYQQFFTQILCKTPLQETETPVANPLPVLYSLMTNR